MIIVQVKENENIEKALKKFKRKFERTGIIKELRARQAFEKPSVTNRKKMVKAIYVQQLRQAEQSSASFTSDIANIYCRYDITPDAVPICRVFKSSYRTGVAPETNQS